MQFGLYAPLPHVTVGSPAMSQAVDASMAPLPPDAVDGAYQLARDVLLEADRQGFETILFAERHLGADLEAWILGSALASLLTQARAMIAVHPGLWRPELIAKMATSLDRIARGRMAINLVTGWNVEEHRMFGGDTMLGDDERYIRAEEFVSVLRGLWTETPFSHDGRFFSVDRSELRLRPATPTPPEIFTASRSPRGLDMVAQCADWWFLGFDKDAKTTADVVASLKASIADMDRRAARLGRKIRYAFNPFVACDVSEEAAMARALRLLAPDVPDFDNKKMMERIGPAMKAGCIGTPDKVRAQLRDYHAMGIEFFLLKFVPTVKEVAMIGQEIIAPLRVGLAPLSAGLEKPATAA